MTGNMTLSNSLQFNPFLFVYAINKQGIMSKLSFRDIYSWFFPTPGDSRATWTPLFYSNLR